MIKFSENLKKLRKEKKLTQEELAGFFHISSQTLSKWERGDSTPDITMLPTIAGFFQISVDELLGMDELRQKDKLEELHSEWKENNSIGNDLENVRLMREALLRYPENYQLMMQLVISLEKSGGSDEEIQKNREEAIEVSERIVRHCPDDQIRNRVLFNLSFSYFHSGNIELALERAGQLSGITKSRENALIMFEKGKDRIQTGQSAVQSLIESIYHQISCICNENYYKSNQKIDLLNRFIKIAEIIYEQDDVAEVLRCKTNAYMKMADIYMMEQDFDKARDCLQLADAVIDRSEQVEQQKHTGSILATYLNREGLFNSSYQRQLLEKKINSEKYAQAGIDLKNKKIKKYQYFFFDLDGTITDSSEGITKGVSYALSSFGIAETDMDKLCRFIGPPMTDSFRLFYDFDEEKSKEAIQKYREYYSEFGVYENTLYEGIKEMLQKLNEIGAKVVLATSKPEFYAQKILEMFEIDSEFCFLSGSNMDLTRYKKSEVIAHAVKSLGIWTEDVLMVGDRDFDVIGAKENDMDCAGVLYGFGNREELEAAGAKYIAKDVSELTELLLSLCR